MGKKLSAKKMNNENTQKWLDKWNIKNYTINEDGSVDVNGCVYIQRKDIPGKISDYVTFGVVSGEFDCSHNNFISLEGAPKKVGWSFWCANNNLTSLKYAPEIASSFGSSFNIKNFTEYDVREVSKVDHSIYISSYKKVKGVETRHLIAHKMSLTFGKTSDIPIVNTYEVEKDVFVHYKMFNYCKEIPNILRELRK